ncbi:hypothetical protein Metli_1333 [Methanofollis liminatans DSM 4140]|uniref:Uncharacterized protein n=1 Tax=Methanofollis liminatans DSM 4140 TaxID=28892 RepID=J1AQN5_9EURY|nr:hypothetical protein [Methanofollis liminatans]EJG07288.1 hypothetical protein Metli_1333 [Methanofollis liminatans DSM 4140]
MKLIKTLRRDVFDQLPTINKAVALVMVEKGDLRLIDEPEYFKGSRQGDGASR